MLETQEVDMDEAYARAETRFWPNVDSSRGPSGCWLWLGRQLDGYGYLPAKAPRKGVVLAHRLSFVLAHGPIPTGRSVAHACDVPACVNPAHLRAMTHAENIADRAAKGRSARCGAVKKLTAEAVAEIRQGGSSRDLAARFGVSRTTIRKVRSGATWSHV